MDLNKHIATDNINRPFHSNGYAQVAVGNRVGSVGNISFNQRQQIDRNRRIVYGYNRSAIGNSITYGAMRAKSVLPVNNGIKVDSALQRHNSTNGTTPRTPNGPTHQSYNPYA